MLGKFLKCSDFLSVDLYQQVYAQIALFSCLPTLILLIISYRDFIRAVVVAIIINYILIHCVFLQ